MAVFFLNGVFLQCFCPRPTDLPIFVFIDGENWNSTGGERGGFRGRGGRGEMWTELLTPPNTNKTLFHVCQCMKCDSTKCRVSDQYFIYS